MLDKTLTALTVYKTEKEERKKLEIKTTSTYAPGLTTAYRIVIRKKEFEI